MEIRDQAATVAAGTQPVGIGLEIIASIAEILIPQLIKCWAANHASKPGTVTADAASSAEMQQFLNDHYDAVGGRFDPEFVASMRPQTRRAARRQGQRRLGPGQLDVITVSTLTKARTTNLPDVRACMAEAFAMPDDTQCDTVMDGDDSSSS